MVDTSKQPFGPEINDGHSDELVVEKPAPRKQEQRHGGDTNDE